MVWTDDQRPGYGIESIIYAQRLDSSGKTMWATDGIPVSAPYFITAEIPLIIEDKKGGAIIIYSRSRIGGAIDNFAQHIDAKGKLLWGVNGIPITDTTQDSRLNNNRVNHETAVADGTGGVFVVWQQYFRGIAAQHIDADGNKLWGGNGVLPVTDADSSGRYTSYIVNTGAGTAVMAFQSAASVNLRMQRIAANGALLWGNDGVLAVNGTFTESTNAYLLYDSRSATKNVMLVWPDSRNRAPGTSYTNLYAQKFDMNGNPLWQSNGVGIAAGAGDYTYPTLLTDSAGGFLMSYSNNNTPGLQHVDNSGVLLWGSTGIATNFIQSENNQPFMCSDGSGGLILMDRERIHGDSLRLAAQRFDASGNALWRTGGVPMIVGYPDLHWTLTPAGNGAAIAAWLDFRVTHTQRPAYVYAAKAGGISGILPISLLSFTATPVKGQVNLAWSTAQETNSSHFDVERSADNHNYTLLQSIPGHINSNIINNYTAVDISPLTGNNFYRLKMVDKNGRFAYSNTVRIYFGEKYNLSLSPVPAHNILLISGADHFDEIQVTDINAKIVMQFTDISKNKFDVSRLLPGTYFIRISANGSTQVLKFIKN